MEHAVTATALKDLIIALAGKAFVTLDDATKAVIDDDQWQPVLGNGLLAIPGGVELDVIDEQLAEAAEKAINLKLDHRTSLVPVRVRNPYWPPVRCGVPYWVLLEHCNEVEPGDGQSAESAPERCAHRDSNVVKRRCNYCFWRWWRARAMEHGITVRADHNVSIVYEERNG